MLARDPQFGVNQYLTSNKSAITSYDSPRFSPWHHRNELCRWMWSHVLLPPPSNRNTWFGSRSSRCVRLICLGHRSDASCYQRLMSALQPCLSNRKLECHSWTHPLGHQIGLCWYRSESDFRFSHFALPTLPYRRSNGLCQSKWRRVSLPKSVSGICRRRRAGWTGSARRRRIARVSTWDVPSCPGFSMGK